MEANLGSSSGTKKSKTIAFIPARAGSKGIPGKNKKLFCGKPLVQWSIDQAIEAGIFDNIIVSSDDEDILAMAESSGVIAAKRKFPLATDEATLDEVLFDYFFEHEDKCKYICLLQPTSPLRTSDDIKETYKLIQKKKYVSVVGVQWNPIMAWVGSFSKEGPACLYLIHKRPNRQTRDDFFLENGAIYWMTRDSLIEYGNRIGNPSATALYEMPPERSLEIDSIFDWYLAEKTNEYEQAPI